MNNLLEKQNMQTVKAAAKVLRAINHPLRQTMMEKIAAVGEIKVTDLYVQMRLEQSVCSQHLKILREQGIVKTERRGKFILYSLDEMRLAKVVELSSSLKTA